MPFPIQFILNCIPDLTFFTLHARAGTLSHLINLFKRQTGRCIWGTLHSKLLSNKHLKGQVTTCIAIQSCLMDICHWIKVIMPNKMLEKHASQLIDLKRSACTYWWYLSHNALLLKEKAKVMHVHVHPC